MELWKSAVDGLSPPNRAGNRSQPISRSSVSDVSLIQVNIHEPALTTQKSLIFKVNNDVAF